MTTVISVENLSKVYRLGQIGTGTFSRDLELWFARLRGKPNPFLRIGQEDHGNRVVDELWALRDVSFSVEQGEVLGIIGRNGAGKSTLLKILSRVTAPTAGKIKVKGRVASLLEVGTGFHPELTGRENVFLNGAILGMTRSEVQRKFDEIVAFAEVEKFIDTPVKRYSSGMYVRLAFAVAAHLEPEILVVDEVLAVGDAEFQKKCLGKMGDVAHEGRTVLFVSHNMAAVTSLCNRCLLIDKGKLIFSGSTLNTIERYTQLHKKINSALDDTVFGSFQNLKIFPQKLVSNDSSLKIECDLYLKNKLSFYQLFLIIQDEQANNLIHSVKSEKNIPIQLSQGNNHLEFLIPSVWLKPGHYKYHLKLMVEAAKGRSRILSSLMPFEVSYFEDSENLIGIINPEIQWLINSQSKEDFE